MRIANLIAPAILIATSSAAFAANQTAENSEMTVLGEMLTDLHFEQAGADIAPELIGGTEISREDYPGVFSTRQGSSGCTGTLIGNQVVASAAHCMNNGGSLTLVYKDVTYSGRCTHATQYRGNATADWALCKLSSPVPDAIAETVNTDGSRFGVNDTLVLMGYGCTSTGGGGGNNGILRMGSAPIRSMPSGTTYDIITTGTSALCYGDSGGPSFFVDQDGKRYQTGINSRGNIRDTSYLSSLHNSTALDFYRSWSEKNSVKICGVHEDAQGCLQGDPIEPMPASCLKAKPFVPMLEACVSKRDNPTALECDVAIKAVDSCLSDR